jgi:diaminobutyrate-2-oxoglutarate transaminase
MSAAHTDAEISVRKGASTTEARTDADSPTPFEWLESEARLYSRSFPAVFETAAGCWLTDEHGRRYLDFFSGAGALNYGHNHPAMKQGLIDYLLADGITHSLDMATVAKREFLRQLDATILKPRGLDYKVQFTGPTGTDAVEAALKLARKSTGRQTVIHFANSFHGMSIGSLAVTGSVSKRASAGVPLHYSLPILFDGDLGDNLDTLDYLAALLEKPNNGLGLPAAVIVETIQAEGGVRVANVEWLRRLEQLVLTHGVLLIVDDIQVGCGRTGDFFSFEESGIKPDIVCLSKSISGYGLPMSLLLIRREIDVWEPGEHTGTFRGNNLAFITGAVALRHWRDDIFGAEIKAKSSYVARTLEDMLADLGLQTDARLRGRGLIQGIEFADESLARNVARNAFGRGLIVETCGPNNAVLKILPPLTITEEELDHGVLIISESLRTCLRAC